MCRSSRETGNVAAVFSTSVIFWELVLEREVWERKYITPRRLGDGLLIVWFCSPGHHLSSGSTTSLSFLELRIFIMKFSALVTLLLSSSAAFAAAMNRDVIQARQAHVKKDLVDVCVALDVDVQLAPGGT